MEEHIDAGLDRGGSGRPGGGHRRATAEARLRGRHHQDGSEADEQLRRENYQLVVLDLILPGLDGKAILQELRRRRSMTPVLVLTARSEVEDKVSILDLGADDYLVKPFDFRELEARCRALLRRPCGMAASTVRFGGLLFDASHGDLIAAFGPQIAMLVFSTSSTTAVMSSCPPSAPARQIEGFPERRISGSSWPSGAKMRQKAVPEKAPAEQIVKDIRRATRRHFSAEEKIRGVLEGPRGEESIAELCRRPGIASSMYYGWSKGANGDLCPSLAAVWRLGTKHSRDRLRGRQAPTSPSARR